jgi:VCBS repeat-containing protein
MNTSLTVPGVGTVGVLANDTDVDGDALSAKWVSGPAHGTLTFNADGSFIYVPAAGYTGRDSFTYKANDGFVDSNIATVNIHVGMIPSNHAPVAYNDGYSTGMNTSLTVPGVGTVGVLANDIDADGDALSAKWVSGPAHGTLTFNADGSFIYAPTTGYTGTDSFTYKANDGFVDSNIATVNIHVGMIPSNHAPVAYNDGYSTGMNTSLTVPGAGTVGVLANDVDVDGDALSAKWVLGPGHGTLTFNADGSFIYVPAAGYTGRDSFTYKANDGFVDSNIATVNIHVGMVPSNHAPVAYNDGYGIQANNLLTVPSATGVLANDTDADNDTLSAIMVSDTAHGSLILSADGSFKYAPTAGYTGTDSFTYKAHDGFANSNIATVSITIYGGGGGNHSPVAYDDAYSTPLNTALTVPTSGIQGVLNNDTDADGDVLIAIQITGPVNGTLTFQNNGAFVYTPTVGFTGSDSFIYKANDGLADSNVATVTIDVGGSKPEPEPEPEPEPNPPTPPKPPVGETEYLVVDFLGNISSQMISKETGLAEILEAKSPDGSHTLRIPKGTRVFDTEGNLVKLIIIREAPENIYVSPKPAVIVGEAYDFAPGGITFDKSVDLTLGYDINMLPNAVASIGLGFYTPGTGWVDLESKSDVVAGVGKLTAPIDHFTVFAVLAKPTEAAFTTGNLLITPSEKTYWRLFPMVVVKGREVTISLGVNNYGGKSGVFSVDLKIDGQVIGQKSITVDASQTQVLTFTVTEMKSGQHAFELGQHTGEFVTSWVIRWWLIPILLLVILVLGFIVKKYILE